MSIEPIKKKIVEESKEVEEKQIVKRPTIEISVQMFEFQKRFWWLLSSLAQQRSWEGHEVPDIIVKISTMSERDRFKDLTVKLIKTFDPLLNLNVKEYHDFRAFGRRGQTRNEDIKETTADWLFFTDADTVFHPEFFSEISAHYIDEWKGLGKVITASRMNVRETNAEELVNNVNYNECKPVENAFDMCWVKKGRYSCCGKAPGAGYFQMVEADFLKKNSMTYCSTRRADRSLFDNLGNKYKSDIIFRKKTNGVIKMQKPKDETGSRDILKPIIHLNHWRRTYENYIDKGR